MNEFGVGTYTRNIVRALGRLDRTNIFFLLGSKDKVAEMGALPANFQAGSLREQDTSVKGYRDCRTGVKRLQCELVDMPHLFWMPRTLPCAYVIALHDLLHHFAPAE